MTASPSSAEPKRATIGHKPATDPASTWVRQADAPRASASIYSARLTIDVAPELRARIKVQAFERGSTVAEMLRGLLKREYGEGQA